MFQVLKECLVLMHPLPKEVSSPHGGAAAEVILRMGMLELLGQSALGFCMSAHTPTRTA